MSGKTDRTARLLVHLFARGGLSTSEAARLCGVTSRLARKDLNALMKVAPVRPMGEGRARRWVFDGERSLGTLDRISLRVGREVTRFLEGTSLHRGFDRLREIEADAIPGRIRYLPEPARKYGPREDIVDACLDGLLRTRTLAIGYEKPTGAADRYDRFQPLTLIVYRRALYLVGRLGRNTYTLAIDRMEGATIGEPFEYPADWDVDQWLSGRFGLTLSGDEEPQDVVLKFSATVAHLVRAREWHPTQTLVELPDGEVMLCMRTAGRELTRFVLEWGEHCQVLGPAGLRDRVVGELRNALAKYGDRP